MALIRLAGMGLKGLAGLGAKKGIGKAIAPAVRGLAADAAILGGGSAAIGTAMDLGLNDGIYNRQQELLEQGPREDGTYRINLGDKINSGISGFFGGNTIDPASMKTAKGNRNFQEINKPENALLKAALIEQGVDLSKAGRGTENILSLSAEFAEPIAATKRKKAFETGEKEYTQSQRYLDAITERDYNRGVQETAREDRLSREKQTRGDRLSREKQARLDSIDNRESSYNQAMAELDFKKGQSNREFDYQDRVLDYKSKQRKAERMQQIAMALGALPGLFGV